VIFPKAGRRRHPRPLLPRQACSCLHVPAAQAPSLVAFRDSQLGKALFAVSEVAKSPSRAAAQDTFKALSEPAAARCIESATRSALGDIGDRASIEVNRIRPPSTGGNPAVAYEESVATADRTAQIGRGSAVFFTHGKVSALIGGFSVGTSRSRPI
jgi:hypothetical protein